MQRDCAIFIYFTYENHNMIALPTKKNQRNKFTTVSFLILDLFKNLGLEEPQ